VALREVASLDGQARSWVALGDMLTRAGRTAEAVHAFRQGLWLHGQSGAEARARVVAELVLRIEPGDRLAARYARSEPWAA
jgi:predicted RNA polymerase sigma factor